MGSPNIIVNPWHKDKEYQQKKAALVAAENNYIPLRIRCPQCQMIYVLYIESLEQGLHTLLGQACPFCKRFIKESDDPKHLLVDAGDVRKKMEGQNAGGSGKAER